MTRLFTLLVVYQVKHFLADYPLQTPWMLGKFKPGWAFLAPLAAHAGVHGGATLLIALGATLDVRKAILLAILDFTVHFTVDRIKASPKMLGRWNPTQSEFWLALGLDQMCHHLTHYLIIWVLCS